MGLNIIKPGLLDGARVIDRQPPDPVYEAKVREAMQQPPALKELSVPKIGDVFQENDSDPLFQAMVIAVWGNDIALGGNVTVYKNELNDTEKWSFIHNVLDQSNIG